MASMTAQILVGQSHTYDGGINPTHYLFLSENSRPAWTLTRENVFHTAEERNHGKIVWIPSTENMLEDGLLMIALYVLEDAEIQQTARELLEWKGDSYIEVYNIKPEDRKRLYEMSRGLKNHYKIIISVFNGSTITRQLESINDYGMEVEICKSSYVREFNVWSNEMDVRGSLDQERGC